MHASAFEVRAVDEFTSQPSAILAQLNVLRVDLGLALVVHFFAGVMPPMDADHDKDCDGFEFQFIVQFLKTSASSVAYELIQEVDAINHFW